MKGGAAAQRSHDLQQEGEERYNAVFLFHITLSTHELCSACHCFYSDLMKSLFCFLRQEISTTIPAVHDAADVIKCSQKERKCICKVCKISLICMLAGSIFFTVSFIQILLHFIKKNLLILKRSTVILINEHCLPT